MCLYCWCTVVAGVILINGFSRCRGYWIRYLCILLSICRAYIYIYINMFGWLCRATCCSRRTNAPAGRVDRNWTKPGGKASWPGFLLVGELAQVPHYPETRASPGCLLYTSDAADE